ncbi:haloalkane dehalogenase [Fulvimonas sp. R45]|uniref:haloalkane dehalogenase n=1 Tax=Fulvimonas sp. R45 TaxID=3045937 RepID=UPI00265EB222|nr:haloalkane dehalogenase [Fulvimonas sp. R45]MDO1527535.1 haloalkane dehalogenase [Fulvimonas sp. R45]
MNDVLLPRVSVYGSNMAYRSMGDRSKPVVLFLHGNPTSSYIWRNIMPVVSEVAYCIAPDLIGFGQSDKPGIRYGFADHIAYLDRFLVELGIDQAHLIAQDWGTALAFELAARRPPLVRSLGFMEFIRPMESWDAFHQTQQARDIFMKLRTPGVGEQLVLRENFFVEKILPGSVHRKLGDEEMAVYRAPFPDETSRIPTLRLPNELPIAGNPRDVHDSLTKAHAALAASTYPKTLFVGNPGALVSPAFARSFAARLKNCDLVELGAGAHYLQEDHPQAIAEGVVTLIERAEMQRGQPVAA